MNDDLEEIKRQTKHGLLLTPYIKIKLDSDMDQAALVLQVVEEETRVHVGKNSPYFLYVSHSGRQVGAQGETHVDNRRQFLLECRHDAPLPHNALSTLQGQSVPPPLYLWFSVSDCRLVHVGTAISSEFEGVKCGGDGRVEEG